MDALKARRQAAADEVVRRRTRQQEQFWTFRDDALGSTSKIPNQPDYYPGWEDSAVDPKRLGDYMRKFRADARRVRLRRLDLRPLRPRLRARQHQLRSLHGGRHREVPRVRHEDGAHLRRARRLALRRTRRRAGARRAAADHVRRRTRRSVLGVQVDLGSAAQDESRQSRASV